MSLIAVVLIPVAVDLRGFDPFRVPKEALFMAAAILAGAILAIGWLRRELDFRPLVRHRLVWMILLAIVGWTLLTTLTSTNRALSWQTLALVIASAVLFAGFYLAATKLPLAAASVVFAAGVPNAVVLLVQYFGIWNFVDLNQLGDPLWVRRYGLTGLLGNANDAGVYLLANMLVALALALEVRGSLRVVCFALAALMGAGMAATLTLTTIITAVVAVAVLITARLMKNRWSWRLVFAGVAMLVVLAGAALAVRPIRDRIASSVTAARGGNLAAAFSGRPMGWMTAWRMFVNRPFLGVGPGCFKFHYFDMRSEIIVGKRELWEVAPINFGEAHNDHLQVLAESGVIGYAIYLVANLAVAGISFRGRGRPPLHDDERARFARTIALPAVVGLLVASMAQFPMELAAPRVTYLFTYALCLNWSMRWSDAS